MIVPAVQEIYTEYVDRSARDLAESLVDKVSDKSFPSAYILSGLFTSYQNSINTHLREHYPNKEWVGTFVICPYADMLPNMEIALLRKTPYESIVELEHYKMRCRSLRVLDFMIIVLARDPCVKRQDYRGNAILYSRKFHISPKNKSLCLNRWNVFINGYQTTTYILADNYQAALGAATHHIYTAAEVCLDTRNINEEACFNCNHYDVRTSICLWDNERKYSRDSCKADLGGYWIPKIYLETVRERVASADSVSYCSVCDRVCSFGSVYCDRCGRETDIVDLLPGQDFDRDPASSMTIEMWNGGDEKKK